MPGVPASVIRAMSFPFSFLLLKHRLFRFYCIRDNSSAEYGYQNDLKAGCCFWYPPPQSDRPPEAPRRTRIVMSSRFPIGVAHRYSFPLIFAHTFTFRMLFDPGIIVSVNIINLLCIHARFLIHDQRRLTGDP